LMFELTFLPSSLFTIPIPMLPVIGLLIGLLQTPRYLASENRWSGAALNSPHSEAQDSRY
jgi:hypothetical protein